MPSATVNACLGFGVLFIVCVAISIGLGTLGTIILSGLCAAGVAITWCYLLCSSGASDSPSSSGSQGKPTSIEADIKLQIEDKVEITTQLAPKGKKRRLYCMCAAWR